MRILTGGHAIWMGGWTGQVHHHQDIIEPDDQHRSPEVMTVLQNMAVHVGEGLHMLPAAYALADSLLHEGLRIMPPDEIDPDYLEQDERQSLRDALIHLGCSLDRAGALAAPYEDVLRLEGGLEI